MIKIHIKANSQAQYEVMSLTGKKDKLREVLYYGGLGCGKTISIGVVVTRYIAHPRSSVIVTRSTAVDCWRTTMRTLLYGDAVTRPILPPDIVGSVNEQRGEVQLKNGSNIWVRGLDNVAKLGSLSGSLVVTDELPLADESEWRGLVQRCRVPHPLGVLAVAACNPVDPSLWVHSYFSKREMIRGKTQDNIKHLDPSYVAWLATLDPITRARLLNGEWVTDATNKVFYAWTPDAPCEYDDTLGAEVGYIIVQDFGGGSGVAAMTLGHVYENGGIIEEEWGGRRKTHGDALEQMNVWRDTFGTNTCVYDPANAALANDMLEAGFNLIKPNKRLSTTISAVNTELGRNTLRISRSCVRVREELSRLTLDAYGGIKKVQGWDFADCVRYFISGRLYLNA